MRYTLAILTHGLDDTQIRRAYAAFREHVTPNPTSMLVMIDGDSRRDPALSVDGLGLEFWQRMWTGQQQGFCTASRALWTAAVKADDEYVFWLEHDFLITRDVDLAEIAAVLDANHDLAQMQLMRQAVNETEIAAGGLFESRPGQYDRQTTFIDRFKGDPGLPDTPHELIERPWLKHSAYMSTNPCLMRTEFMRTEPWPAYPQECEGRFGIDLIDLGYTFGVWGNGEPWCEHIGIRTGFGY